MSPKTVLLIDAGNTRIKWALWDGRALSSIASRKRDDLSGLSQEISGLAFTRALGCNVAGAKVASALEEALQTSGVALEWSAPQRDCLGVHTRYQNLAQLGPDRWLSVIAAAQKALGNVLVVNAGTALTVDCLTKEGDYLGGTISPGFRLMRESLSQNTARLGLPEGAYTSFPQSTPEAIYSGVLNALVGAIERQAAHLQERTQSIDACLLSGGDAMLLAPFLRMPTLQVENLVLAGLAALSSLSVKTL